MAQRWNMLRLQSQPPPLQLQPPHPSLRLLSKRMEGPQFFGRQVPQAPSGAFFMGHP